MLSVKQIEGESLRAYVHRFNEEAMKIDRPKEDVIVTAFMAGLRKGDFLYDLCKDPPETLSELMYEAQKHMNAEDTLEAMDDPPPRDEKTLRIVNRNLPNRRFQNSPRPRRVNERPLPL